MASIVKRNNRYCVVYTYKHTNGTLKQKWETFTDLADAKNRKKEVEYKESVGTFVAPQCRTLKDLLKEYVTLYGRTKWALSTYQSNTALISNYIEPLIGSMKLQDLTTRVIEGYYQRLLKYEAVDPMCGKRQHQYVSPGTVRSVHKILRSAFEQAVKWELMEKNPCIYATLPKYTAKKRDIWTAETLFHALEVCDDPRLRLCINLSFSCSLRLGELLGLTWDCVDISPESIEAGRASIYIEIVIYLEANFLSGFDFKFFQNRIWEFYSSIFTDYNIKFLFHRTLLKSRKVPCIQCLYSRKNTISPFLLQDNAHFHSHCYIDQSFLAESSGLFLLKTFVHHTSYGCMVWFTNAKQANIRRETYTSQLMKGGHFTMNLPLFISSANFLLMKSLLLVLFRGLCSLLRLTAQQKIN